MAASRAIARTQPHGRPRRAAVAVAALGLMMISNVALATAANPSVPGDALYRLDRAYESLGRLVGWAGDIRSERIDEAAIVAARGDRTTALDLVREALEGIDGEGEAAAALALIESLSEAGADSGQIADLLDIARSAADEAERTGGVVDGS
jgi:hypothetical protein